MPVVKAMGSTAIWLLCLPMLAFEVVLALWLVTRGVAPNPGEQF